MPATLSNLLSNIVVQFIWHLWQQRTTKSKSSQQQKTILANSHDIQNSSFLNNKGVLFYLFKTNRERYYLNWLWPKIEESKNIFSRNFLSCSLWGINKIIPLSAQWLTIARWREGLWHNPARPFGVSCYEACLNRRLDISRDFLQSNSTLEILVVVICILKQQWHKKK